MTRRGVTLVELLIVILIMLLITGVVIRVTAPALTGRRLREAARMLDVYINGARSRALQTGRSYGVMIARTPVPNSITGVWTSSMGISVAYAEVPPPYTGDFTTSRMCVLGNGAFGAWQRPFTVPVPLPFPTMPPFSVADFSTDPIFTFGDVGMISNVSPGDILVINGTQYRIWAGEPFIDLNNDGIYELGEPYADCDLSGGYTPPNAAYIDSVTGFFNAVPLPGTAIMTYMYFDPTFAANTMTVSGRDTNGNPIFFGALPSHDPTSSNTPVPSYGFQIIRRPIKAAGTDLQLPDGAAIDLGGFDLSGSTSLTNVVPGSGMDIFSSSAGVPPYFATFRLNPSLGANDVSPIIITFAPNGVVDKVYSWDERNFAAWQGRQPTSQIYLLVTRRELVGGDASVTAAPSSATPQYGIQDLTSVWVTINPQTGLVNTAANGPLGPALFAGSPPPYYLQCYEARQIARQTQTLGGR